MKTVAAFFRLIRWPNLVFIVLTQVLFYYCIVLTTNNLNGFQLPFKFLQSLFLITISTILIAAAGYVINDYFDLNIDQVNKPNKLVVNRFINRRWTILLHQIFSFLGVLISIWIFIKDGVFIILIINILSVTLLWFYSTTFKKKLLIGNIIVSILTAFVILVFYFYLISIPSREVVVPGWHTTFTTFYDSKLTRIAILYASFSFIISLIREVIKDMEDIEGDEKYGCKTMPIVWGIPASKVFVGVWIVVLIAVLTILQFYVMQFNWWLSIAYCVLFIITPLLIILQKLSKAQSTKDYHQLSSLVKLVMFTGILSMIFFRIYS
ncbi:MAG: geranylgeranylglycerol-phosphate geranylgeranyltransferase [Ferruginibacter sp.]|nr:geranylgeranylglycerol-phosphate geranylgeranyltransferase [Ferruginibacter sp.]